MAVNTDAAADTLDVSIALGLVAGAAIGYFLLDSWIIGIVGGVILGSIIGLVRAGD